MENAEFCSFGANMIETDPRAAQRLPGGYFKNNISSS